MLAKPPVRVAVPSETPPSRKLTVPVGAALAPAGATTCVEMMIACPKKAGLGLAPRTTEVALEVGFRITGAEALPRKLLSPGYWAVNEWPPCVRVMVRLARPLTRAAEPM